MTAPRVNPIRCQAYGTCARIAPHLFALDDWGYAVATPPTTDEPPDPELLREAVDACPARAIVLITPQERR